MTLRDNVVVYIFDLCELIKRDKIFDTNNSFCYGSERLS